MRLRQEGVRPTEGSIEGGAVKGGGANASRVESWGWRGWAALYASPALYRLAGRVLAVMGNWLPPGLPMLREWTRVRSRPRFAARTLHQLARDRGFDDE